MSPAKKQSKRGAAPVAPLAVYVRVSSKGDRDESEGYRTKREQEERARSHAESKGYTTDGLFTDEDVSGGKHPEERPAMAELLAKVKSGEVGGITAFSLDRLSRDPAHGEWLIKEVTRHGGVITTPDMPEDITSATGEFTFNQLLAVARLYRRMSGERWKLAKVGSIMSGVPVSQPPVGYRRVCDGPSGDPKDRRLEIDPEAAPIIRRLFEQRAQGVGRGTLHKQLVAETGRSWAREAIRVIIANPIYKTGRLRYQLVRNDESSWIESEWAAEPIVGEALWEAAQVEPNRKPQRAKDPDSPWLLTGFAVCSECGYNLKPHQQGAHKPNGPYRYYVCDHGCKVRASAPKLEADVTQLLVSRSKMTTTDPGPKLGPLEAAVADALARYEYIKSDEAADAYGSDHLPEVAKRRLAYEQAQAELGRAQADGAGGSTTTVEDLEAKWQAMTGLERKQLLGRFLAGVRVGGSKPEAWEIVWR